MHILKSLKLLFNYYMPIYACAVVHVWSEGQLVVLALSFHHVSPGSETQAVRVGCKYLLPVSYLTGSECTSHYINFSLTMF